MNTTHETDIEFHKLDVLGRIQQIEEGLLTRDPMMPTHLAAVHKTLIQYEELVHMLPDEAVKSLIAGQKKHVNVMLVKEIASKRVSTAKIPRASADDF